LEQGTLDFCEIRQFPLSPRGHGRLTARRGLGVEWCPYPDLSAAEGDWLDGWAEGFGIPPGPAREADLCNRYLACSSALRAVRDNPTVPADVREMARRTLNGESAEVMEG
jgi:hypothetical protein